MSNLKKHLCHGVLISLLIGNVAYADTQGFQYPELLVTPRASERLEMEAKKEPSKAWTRLIPIQISAFTTLSAGLLVRNATNLGNDPTGDSWMVGVGVGGAWLATTLLMSAYYHPYQSGLAEVNEMPKKTEREQLVRERLAEEALDRPARLETKLTYLSIATNALAGAYMIGKANDGSVAKAASIGAVVLAATPFFFRSDWQDVATQQQEYKKRIYGPVASAALLPNPSDHSKVVPGMTLSLQF